MFQIPHFRFQILSSQFKFQIPLIRFQNSKLKRGNQQTQAGEPGWTNDSHRPLRVLPQCDPNKGVCSFNVNDLHSDLNFQITDFRFKIQIPCSRFIISDYKAQARIQKFGFRFRIPHFRFLIMISEFRFLIIRFRFRL